MILNCSKVDCVFIVYSWFQNQSIYSIYHSRTVLINHICKKYACMFEYFFHRVAESEECKMPLYNLAKVFGPTIIGYSVAQPVPATILNETHLQQVVSLLITS